MLRNLRGCPGSGEEGSGRSLHVIAGYAPHSQRGWSGLGGVRNEARISGTSASLRRATSESKWGDDSKEKKASFLTKLDSPACTLAPRRVRWQGATHSARRSRSTLRSLTTARRTGAVSRFGSISSTRGTPNVRGGSSLLSSRARATREERRSLIGGLSHDATPAAIVARHAELYATKHGLVRNTLREDVDRVRLRWRLSAAPAGTEIRCSYANCMTGDVIALANLAKSPPTCIYLPQCRPRLLPSFVPRCFVIDAVLRISI